MILICPAPVKLSSLILFSMAFLYGLCSDGRVGTADEAVQNLKADKNFPGGSGDVESIDQKSRIIRFQPTAYPEQGWACWWSLKITGIQPGETLTLNVGGGVWATPDQCFFSTDGTTWNQSEPGQRSSTEKGRITYQIKVDSSEAWFAWGPPFTLKDAQELVRSAASHASWVKAFNLATTRGGHETPALRIREPGSPDNERVGIWLQARQHAWESGSSWVGQGALNWLLSSDPLAVKFRQKTDIVFVPIMDVDHVEQGAGGKGAIPQDHNRDWSDRPYWRSVEAAQQLILEMNETGNFGVFIDLHNPDAQSKNPFFFLTPEDELSPEALKNQTRFLEIARKEMGNPLAFLGTVRESGRQYDPNWEKISKNWVAKHCRPGVISNTLEVPWNTPHSTPAGYQHVGAGLARTVATYVLTKENADSSTKDGTSRATDQKHRQISGIYPHLTTYAAYSKGEEHNHPGHEECGIGAIVPWANKLWMVNYAPHKPRGSDHKLFSIDSHLEMTIHPESVGGTPAARMIHRESNQLLMGHYLINSEGRVRVIPPEEMPIRVTAICRHLTDPANMVYYIDMEGSIWEANVHTLETKRLFEKPVPGWHAKGGYTSQGRLVISNNGELAVGKGQHQFLVGDVSRTEEEAGILAEWNGTDWKIIERRQFTDIMSPDGIYGGKTSQEPLWAIGWDRRSLRLKLLENGVWSTYLLPKASWCNDARHGWYTEWPRIRDIGHDRWLMDMHGMFFDFPQTFSTKNSAGIRPISSHLRYIPDFCNWNGQLVLATNETSIQGNPLAGQPQSNLWFGTREDLFHWGPTNGYGGPWSNDRVKAGVASDPFLISGFKKRVLHCAVTDSAGTDVRFTLEIDRSGNNQWEELTRLSISPGKLTSYFLDEKLNAIWIRLKADRDCTATAIFHQTTPRMYSAEADAKDGLFEGLADLDDAETVAGRLYPAKKNRNLSVISKEGQFLEFTKSDFQFRPVEEDLELSKLIAFKSRFTVDDASVVLIDGEQRYRLPKGDPQFDKLVNGNQIRTLREVESERYLANVHGTFYEFPLLLNGPVFSYRQIRPVASHSRQIFDYATWNGLLVLSGIKKGAQPGEHIYVDPEGEMSLWFGGIDDLWKLGKPTGEGGPWHQTAVQKDRPSDPYLMTGYDQKSLELISDRDVTVALEVEVDAHSGWHRFLEIPLQANQPQSYQFEKGFSAHWIRLIPNQSATVTATFIYE